MGRWKRRPYKWFSSTDGQEGGVFGIGYRGKKTKCFVWLFFPYVFASFSPVCLPVREELGRDSAGGRAAALSFFLSAVLAALQPFPRSDDIMVVPAGLDVLPAFQSVYDRSQMCVQEHTVLYPNQGIYET